MNLSDHYFSHYPKSNQSQHHAETAAFLWLWTVVEFKHQAPYSGPPVPTAWNILCDRDFTPGQPWPLWLTLCKPAPTGCSRPCVVDEAQAEWDCVFCSSLQGSLCISSCVSPWAHTRISLACLWEVCVTATWLALEMRQSRREGCQSLGKLQELVHASLASFSSNLQGSRVAVPCVWVLV